MSSSVEAELRLQEGRLLEAMRARDIVTLSQLFDPDDVFTSAGGRVWDREQALRDFSEPGFTPGQIEVELERAIPLCRRQKSRHAARPWGDRVTPVT